MGRGKGWLAFGVVWVLALALGFTLLWKYKMRPGDAEGTPAIWPSESRIAASDRATWCSSPIECPCEPAWPRPAPPGASTTG